MRVILQSVLALLLGLIVGGFLGFAVEVMGQVYYPLSIDPNEPDASKEALADAPVIALLIMLAAWALGSCGGASTAALIAPRFPVVHGLFIGGFFMLFAVERMVRIEYPLWFQIAATLVFLPAAYFGARRASRSRRFAK